jgi:hypothetical protein
VTFSTVRFCTFRKVTLAGVGVRVKQLGPIKAKVYSAALYLDKATTSAKLKKLKFLDIKKLSSSSDFEDLVSPNLLGIRYYQQLLFLLFDVEVDLFRLFIVSNLLFASSW